MTFRDKASFGKRMEFVVIGELLREGHDVYLTLVDDRGIDCIIRTDSGKYFDIQIKARSKDSKWYLAGTFSNLVVENPRQNYIFICYSERLDSTWIIPSTDLVKIASRHHVNGNSYQLNLTGRNKGAPNLKPQFEKYRNRSGFALLKSMTDS